MSFAGRGLPAESPAYHTPLPHDSPSPPERVSQTGYDGSMFKTLNTVSASGANRFSREDMFEVRGKLRQGPVVHKEADSLKLLPLPTPSQFRQWKLKTLHFNA